MGIIPDDLTWRKSVRMSKESALPVLEAAHHLYARSQPASYIYRQLNKERAFKHGKHWVVWEMGWLNAARGEFEAILETKELKGDERATLNRAIRFIEGLEPEPPIDPIALIRTGAFTEHALASTLLTARDREEPIDPVVHQYMLERHPRLATLTGDEWFLKLFEGFKKQKGLLHDRDQLLRKVPDGPSTLVGSTLSLQKGGDLKKVFTITLREDTGPEGSCSWLDFRLEVQSANMSHLVSGTWVPWRCARVGLGRNKPGRRDAPLYGRALQNDREWGFWWELLKENTDNLIDEDWL